MKYSYYMLIFLINWLWITRSSNVLWTNLTISLSLSNNWIKYLNYLYLWVIFKFNFAFWKLSFSDCVGITKMSKWTHLIEWITLKWPRDLSQSLSLSLFYFYLPPSEIILSGNKTLTLLTLWFYRFYLYWLLCFCFQT